MADTITGINTAKITAMKTAIDDWAKAVDNKKITVASKEVTKALKGSTQEAAVKKLCQACDSYANTLTAKLRAYKTRLDEVKTAYEKNDTSSTAVSDVTAKVDSLRS